jgi:hypothetical protein
LSKDLIDEFKKTQQAN